MALFSFLFSFFDDYFCGLFLPSPISSFFVVLVIFLVSYSIIFVAAVFVDCVPLPFPFSLALSKEVWREAPHLFVTGCCWLRWNGAKRRSVWQRQHMVSMLLWEWTNERREAPFVLLTASAYDPFLLCFFLFWILLLNSFSVREAINRAREINSLQSCPFSNDQNSVNFWPISPKKNAHESENDNLLQKEALTVDRTQDLLITNQMLYHWAIRAVFFYCYIAKETFTILTHCYRWVFLLSS